MKPEKRNPNAQAQNTLLLLQRGSERTEHEFDVQQEDGFVLEGLLALDVDGVQHVLDEHVHGHRQQDRVLKRDVSRDDATLI